MQYHRWELGRVRGRGRGRAVDRARRDPEEGQGYRRLSTTCLRTQGPRLSLLGEKRGLPPAYEDLFSTPLPRGTQAPGPAALRMQRGLTSRQPPASRSTGVPSTAAIAQPLLLTVARSQYFAQNARDPTSTSGVLPKEAVPLPSRPSADRLCPRIRVRAPRSPPTGLGFSSAQTRSAQSSAGSRMGRFLNGPAPGRLEHLLVPALGG